MVAQIVSPTLLPSAPDYLYIHFQIAMRIRRPGKASRSLQRCLKSSVWEKLCFIAAHSRLAQECPGATTRRPLSLAHSVATAGHSRDPLPLHRVALSAVSAISRASGQSTLRPIHLYPFRHLQSQILLFYTVYEICRKSKRLPRSIIPHLS